MDKKRFLLITVLSVLLVFGWQLFLAWQWSRHPEWKRADATETAATQPAAVTPLPQTGPAPATAPLAVERPTSAPATVAAAPTTTSQPATDVAPPQLTAATGLRVLNAAPAGNPIVLGSVAAKDAAYSLGVQLSGTGGGIDSVTLNRYNDVDGKALYQFQKLGDAMPASSRPLATRTLLVRDSSGRERDIDLAGVVWQLEKYSPADQSATYFVEVGESPKQPLARLRKTFRVFPANDASHPGGYEATLDYALENLTASPLTMWQSFNGVITPPRELDRGGDRQIMVGYWNGSKVDIERHLVEEFTKDKSSQELQKYKDKPWPLTWVGTASAYFNATVQMQPPQGQTAFTPLSQDPKDAGKPQPNASPIDKVISKALNPSEEKADLREVGTEIHTVGLQVGPHGSYVLPTINLFLGPRDRALLDQKPYNVPPRDYLETLNTATGPCSICTFSWLIGALSWLLGVFHWPLHDWGLAIIALVAVVRVCLHPLLRKSQVSMARMQKMAPEIERLKKKYGDNKEELNKAMVHVYKEQGVAPLLGCLPMLLQMPIWIALYSSLQTNIELRQEPFLWNFTWIHNLVRPDRLYTFANPISLPFGMTISSINILPLLMAVVMYIQQKMTPKPVTADPQQASMQKMMMGMSVLMFPLFLYNGPSGLNLYILTSTTVGIIEQRVIRNHIKQKEEAEKAGRVFVEAKPTRAGKRLAEEAKKDVPVKETWLQRLQRKAEEMQREADKRKKR